MKYQLFANNELIGESNLEVGDPPMGVASGEFHPNKNYFKYQSLFESQNTEVLNLCVKSSSGQTLEPAGGIGVEDYSQEMGEQSIQINVLGLDSEVYVKLFPEHVAKYDALFKQGN